MLLHHYGFLLQEQESSCSVTPQRDCNRQYVLLLLQ
ncbi:hypothetical protein CP8484711_1483, partial [Chlamydia psittaci 84-8471/1]